MCKFLLTKLILSFLLLAELSFQISSWTKNECRCSKKKSTRKDYAMLVHAAGFLQRMPVCVIIIICHLWKMWHGWVQCAAIIMQSIFSKNLTKYTPYLALMGEIWGVFCEVKLWFMFWLICGVVCDMMKYETQTLYCFLYKHIIHQDSVQ